MKNGKRVRAFLDALRGGSHTSIGCYPVFFLMRDGETLSYKAARDEVWTIARATRDGYERQWVYEAHDVNWEDPELYCAHTGARIESAYAEPEVSHGS